MNISRKILIAGMLALGLFAIGFWGNIAHTANPDAFIVEVVPSSFNVNEPVDITIKAVKADGTIVKDYVGYVFIEIEGIVDTADYTVPSEGLYTFLPQDQGVKLFSKGLSIKRSGTFTVKVSDIINDTIVGQKTVIVGAREAAITAEKISIISPIAGGIEKNNIVNVIANAPGLRNSPYEIYVNNIRVSQGMTNANGDISMYVRGIIEGDNILQIKILNAMNEVIGESDVITFAYQPIEDGVFNSITISPMRNIKQGEKTSFTVQTSENVTSAQIRLNDDEFVPMDRQNAGIFTKEIVMDTQGLLQVDVDLIVLGQTKSYTGVATVSVVEGTAIGKIRFYSDNIDKTKLNITREVIGPSAEQYRIDYGTGQDNLNISVTTQINEIILENLVVGEKYYFTITPIDGNGNIIGPASDITEATIGRDVNCVVVGITITTGQIGDKYYLMWSGVMNVEKYIIYRSDFETNEISKMQKIGETTETMFEYPFNPNPASRQYKYAYYLVEAVCKDGTKLMIDNVKKIAVGPVENIILIIMISVFGYIIFKLYGYSKH